MRRTTVPRLLCALLQVCRGRVEVEVYPYLDGIDGLRELRVALECRAPWGSWNVERAIMSEGGASEIEVLVFDLDGPFLACLLYTSPSPRD